MFSRFYILPFFLLTFFLFSNAEAATYIVDCADDVAGATACNAAAPNDCSLRGAIINTNRRTRLHDNRRNFHVFERRSRQIF